MVVQDSKSIIDFDFLVDLSLSDMRNTMVKMIGPNNRIGFGYQVIIKEGGNINGVHLEFPNGHRGPIKPTPLEAARAFAMELRTKVMGIFQDKMKDRGVLDDSMDWRREHTFKSLRKHRCPSQGGWCACTGACWGM